MTDEATTTDSAFQAPSAVALRDETARRFAEVIGRRRRVALLDYPYCRNPGDNAIWLGERAILRDLEATIVHTCDIEGYDRSVLARRLESDDIILLQGGGNFGDLWPQHQLFREQVLRDFPNHRIVQLPESIGIGSSDNEARIRREFARHDGFSFMARDERSQSIATDLLSSPVHLVPDGAFGLGPLRRPVPGAAGTTLVLARTDHESVHSLSGLDFPGAVIEEWQQTDNQRRVWRAKKIVPRIAKKWRSSSGVDRALSAARMSLFDSMAKQLVDEASRQLSSRQIVVTDRLHAHVLCSLLGVPHVLLDSTSGKSMGVYRAWTSGFAPVVVCASADDVPDAVAQVRARFT